MTNACTASSKACEAKAPAIWAIVPVRSLSEGKSRLARILSRAQRKSLKTLSLLLSSASIHRALVVSDDLDALAVARRMGALALREQSPPNLNSALEKAPRFAARRHATGVLVVPNDLPHLSQNDIGRILERRRSAREVILATNERGTGTDLLYLSPPDAIPFSFGENSRVDHQRSAVAARA